MAWKSLCIAVLALALLSGCTTVPQNPLRAGEGGPYVMKEIMARHDRIIHLSSQEMNDGKPVLLLLHGATDDPTEMMDIVRAWRGKYDVYLYAYNYHHRVQTVAANFVNDLKRLRAENRINGDETIVVYSYAAIVFRQAVISTDDRTLFADATLIQLVPIAGGSHLARGIKNPLTAWVVSLFSHPTHAVDPYGNFAAHLWAGAGNQKFYDTINPSRMHSIVVEGDPHSVAGMADPAIRAHYCNGIGQNVIVIPKSPDVNHDYFPTQPAALAYLQKLLEPSVDEAIHNRMQIAVQQ
jgi:hypothetical protein